VKRGDLVDEKNMPGLEYYSDSLRKNGLVLNVKIWRDPNKNKNSGIRATVMWENGEIEVHDYDDLEVVFNE
jgi:hypothetical protein